MIVDLKRLVFVCHAVLGIVLAAGGGYATDTAYAASAKEQPAVKPAKSKPVPSDDDAAYVAFDQGKYLTALSLAEARAAKGDPQAHTLVGRIYEGGHGVGKDEITAARWYARAAQLGDVPAMLAFGAMLAEGRGVGKDRVQAAEMFEKAAATGDPVANYNLGLLFMKGDGKPENPHRGAKHIQYAAEKGVVEAQYDLAVLYLNGVGVPNDALEAAQWMSRAAGRGYMVAEYEYAVMLLRGFGLKSDEPKAVSYLLSAAKKGVPGAQNRLAHIYLEGIAGVEQNTAEAAKWRLIAASQNIEDEKLDLMLKALPEDQMASAQKAAQEWRDKYLVLR